MQSLNDLNSYESLLSLYIDTIGMIWEYKISYFCLLSPLKYRCVPGTIYKVKLCWINLYKFGYKLTQAFL